MRSHVHRVIIVYRHRIRRHGSAYDERSHCQSAERKNPLQCSGHETPPFQHPGRRPRISRLPSLSSPARSLETRPASLHDAISHSHQASRFNAAILSNYAQHLLCSFISGRAERTGYTLNGNVTLTEKRWPRNSKPASCNAEPVSGEVYFHVGIKSIPRSSQYRLHPSASFGNSISSTSQTIPMSTVP